MNRNDSPDDARFASFCIKCRKVRMWIAKHPGVTSPELKAEFGDSYGHMLGYLCNSKLVRWNVVDTPNGGRARSWFVVPQ